MLRKSEGYYDKTVNSYAELELVNTTKKEQATLNPIIVNGRITDVPVDNPGRGYAVAPRVKITDSQGSGAEVELTTQCNRICYRRNHA